MSLPLGRSSVANTRRHPVALASIFVALAVACAGCAGTPDTAPTTTNQEANEATRPTTPPSGEAVEEPVQAPKAPERPAHNPAHNPAQKPTVPDALSLAYQQAVDQQVLRLRRLQFLESSGSIELRWTDSKGKHFEDCQLDLYMMLPSKTAFRISKAAQRVGWIGSDHEKWWMFSLANEPTKLEIRKWADFEGAGMSVVSPRAILHLAGLSPLPRLDQVTMREAAETKELVVDFPGDTLRGEPAMRWTLSRETLLPSTVELLDSQGAIRATGTLRDYVTAPINGAPPGDFPKVPRSIVVVAKDALVGDEASVRLSLDVPSGRGERVKPQFFDLEALIQQFQPAESFVLIPPPAPDAQREPAPEPPPSALPDAGRP